VLDDPRADQRIVVENCHPERSSRRAKAGGNGVEILP
jgi:hypothetical protein